MPTATPFHDIGDYLAVPRVQELRATADGSRVVAVVAELDVDRTKYVSALWELDADGQRPARRITWSSRGESSPRWLPDGSLLFTSARDDDDKAPASLWVLPALGGEAREALRRPGGVTGVAVARAAQVLVAASPTLPRAVDADDDETQRKLRKDRNVSAVLHEQSPIRFWDHDLGPAEVRLIAATLPADASYDVVPEPADLTPRPARALDEQAYAVSPDGRFVVTGWAVDDVPGLPRPTLVLIEVASGEHRVLAAESGVMFGDPAFSPDGSQVACIRVADSTYDEPPRPVLWVVDVHSGEGRELGAAADLWPTSPVWSADGSAVYVTSDHQGHHPIFRVDVESGEVTKVTRSGHYTSITVTDDGTLFALRDHLDQPPTPVRIAAGATDSDGEPLPCPGAVELPGRLEELHVDVDDGATVHSWLVLPDGAAADSPAPLLLWIHGGPLNSWNAWTWRWNPWLMAAHGYAVLLPDPALSTGYGRAMIQRGWGQWGGTPYTDLMAATDEAIKRPDIDESRTAAMGGSYGGYMANWVAGHTDRFRCIVTHASLWALDQFQGTTDHPAYWAREWGLPDANPQRYEQWSPHLFVDRITSPMLVIHGDKDYRVPIGEGLRLWWDLQRHRITSKFLYFPDEGHWVLKPGNAQVWYETVWAWLASYVLDEEWQRPALL